MTNTGASPFVSRCTWYRSVPGSCSLTAAAAVVRSSWTCENLLDRGVWQGRVGGLVYAVGFACLGGKEGDYVDRHFRGFERCF
jgi:hypothetical protein